MAADIYSNLRKGERGAWLSISVYLAFSAIKFIGGSLGNSEALKADALNNSTDVVLSVAVLIGLRISQKPPDRDHRYGHLRAETVASLIASFIMAIVGLQILLGTVGSLQGKVISAPSVSAGLIAFAGGVVMYSVYLYNMRLSKRIGSMALRAAALDNRADALVSFGAALGIIGANLGFPIIDTITALLIALIVIFAAVSVFKEAVHALTDGFDEDEEALLRKRVESVPGISRLCDLKGRMHGSMMLLDLTITVDPELNVIESHRITELIESKIREIRPQSKVFIHIEPDDDPFLCAEVSMK